MSRGLRTYRKYCCSRDFVPNQQLTSCLKYWKTANCDLLIRQLQKIDYQFISKPENPSPHIMFAKGYSESGIIGQTFHIHVRYPGDWDEIIFRDYLINNKNVTADYARLKRKLANEFINDREKYTESKSTFIKNSIQIARKKIIGA